MSKNIIITGALILVAIATYLFYQKESRPEEVMPVADSPYQSQDMQKTEVMEEKIEMNEQVVEYMDISPSEAKKLIDRNPELIIIDVSPHYAKGHIPGAVNYYLGDGSLDKAIPDLDKNKEYLVYCHVDSVAIAGAQKLVDAGFTMVYRLEGNYGTWVNDGFPIEK